MSFKALPKGSILQIKAKDLLYMNPATKQFTYPGQSPITASGQTYSSATATLNNLTDTEKNNYVFRRVSEHNRSEFNIGTNRIERQTRMANGTMRKYFVADKKTFDVSWSMLPSFRNETVDGAWGAEDLKVFYESIDGQKEFEIKIDSYPASNTYTVIFTNCNFTVVKRGLQAFWNVNLSMEQV